MFGVLCLLCFFVFLVSVYIIDMVNDRPLFLLQFTFGTCIVTH